MSHTIPVDPLHKELGWIMFGFIMNLALRHIKYVASNTLITLLDALDIFPIFLTSTNAIGLLSDFMTLDLFCVPPYW